MANEMIDEETGEITYPLYDFWGNEVTQPKINGEYYRRTMRPDGSIRIQQDFTYSPTLAEQHTAHLTDINYLIKKYKPDELAAYIAARNEYRREIVGHDFANELTFQEAKNVVYRSQQEFENLPEDIKTGFKNHVEFLKFIDNPANAGKLLKAGWITKDQLQKLLSMQKVAAADQQTDATTTKEEDAKFSGPAKPSKNAAAKKESAGADDK